MFLKEIADKIIKTHGSNLANIAVIFPNKRASLWMNDYLLEESGGEPVFAPRYCSIQELFMRHSQLSLADHIQLVSILHQTYRKVTGEDETLDQFFPWGEILLADFDNVDKSLADPQQVFRNISGLHEMDTVSYLTEQQKELLERFFLSFSHSHESRIQQKFLALWNNLTDIYLTFRSTLRSDELAYEGMLYRDVAESVRYDNFPLTHYYAVGFNQLLPCEEKLFTILADKLTIKNDEATIHTVNTDARITIAQSLTDDLQTRYAERWLMENNRLAAGRKTAIVLCDERLLPAIIYHLPASAPYNITAGFPLAETPPAISVATALDKNTKKSTADILTHLLTQRPVPEDTPTELMREAAFRVHNIIARLKTLNEQGYLDITPETLARLYKQITLTATIPFHGEPAQGVQVMGMLETRNLDFDHILMLSCNEGVMPKGGDDTSVIPYAIKKAFGLATTDDRSNIFAYYFYRLLKRCKDVTLVYNASGSDTNPGEMSRFLLNLLVNNAKQISRLSLQAALASHPRQPKPVNRPDDATSNILGSSQRLSPTAINTHLRCEKSFYYKYIRHLQEEKDEDESMDAAAFGSFFHNAAEDFYSKLKGERITASLLQPYISKPALLEPHINRALEKTRAELYGTSAQHSATGMEQLLKSIVRKYLQRTLANDQKFTPFTVLDLEGKYYKPYTVSTPDGDITMDIGGAVDRLDLITSDDGQPTLRIVDYKTGIDHGNVKMNSVADIFDNRKEGSGYYRQTILYSLAVENSAERGAQSAKRISPALYYIRNKAIGTSEKYDPALRLAEQPITDIADIKDEFETELHTALHNIFNKPTFDIPDDLAVCSNCPFAELCWE